MKRIALLLIILIGLMIVFTGCKPNSVLPTNVQPITTVTTVNKTPTEVFPTENIETAYPIVEPSEVIPPESGSSASIRSIKMFPTEEGWAVLDNYTILHTDNGGYTWIDVTPDSPLIPTDEYGPGLSTFFITETTGWFMLSEYETATLFRTQDAGESWSITALPFPGGFLYFLNESDGFLLSGLGVAAGSSYVAIYKTEDSGTNWTQTFTHEPGIPKSLPEGGSKSGITFLDTNNGWVGGNIPTEDFIYLYRSIDSGQIWELVNINIPDSINRVFLDTNQPVFVDPNNGFLTVRAYGADDFYPVIFYSTNNAGDTWSDTSILNGINSTDFVDANTAWATSTQGLFVSKDGTLTWQDLKSGLPEDQYILQVDFVNETLGWLLTTPDPQNSQIRYLYKSQNGGLSWVKLPSVIIEPGG